MDTRLFYLFLVALVTARNIHPELGEIGNRIVQSDNVDGYSLATLHALDTATGQLTGQSKRDIEAHASDSTSHKSDFSLHLTSGERLRMTLERRSIDTSATTVTEVTQDGEKETAELQARDCFFSGPLQGAQGFASLWMCGGRVVGSVTTAKRQYEVHSVPALYKRSTDDLMHVLVTWQDTEEALSDDEVMLKRHINDKLENDEDDVYDDDDEADVKRRSVEDRKVVIEVADIMDSHQVNDLSIRKGINETEDIVNLIIGKWTTVAARLYDPDWITWNITLKLVDMQIWRTNPSWYVTNETDTLLTRMKMICLHFKTQPTLYDHIMIHTGDPINGNGKVGVSWIGGVCSKKARCSIVRTVGYGYFYELHEFGHNLGLNHDNKMDSCVNATDTTKGFMGGNPNHFRGCYVPVLDDYFTRDPKSCLHSETNPNLVKLLTNHTVQ